jgi:mannose-1-phosphate guanylyltransferase
MVSARAAMRGFANCPERGLAGPAGNASAALRREKVTVMHRGSTSHSAAGMGTLPHAIVLAGGSGERLRPVTERWLGEHRPKQYCTFIGTRSMLQHTLDRVKTVVPQGNIVTVIAEEHERFLAAAVPEPFPGRLVRQPSNRGTAAGVFLPLAYVLEKDPDAAVMIFPCDHFIYPEGRFVQYVVASFGLCQRLTDAVLLLGVPATSPETDYGWIETERAFGAPAVGPLRRVRRFVEKPTPEEAARLLRRRGLWNTMVVGARASTLWDLGRRFLPDLLEPFDAIRGVARAAQAGSIDGEQERLALRQVYDRLQPADFSRDFLRHAAGSTLVFPLGDLLWSDWGRPKRVMNSLQQLGLQATPRFAHAL